ncbi:MAG TPA: Hsp70 family protein [Kofleriaceae bacterium]
MNDPIVGIDLGTSNMVVAYSDDAGAVRVLADAAGYKIHPSVVSFHPNGGVVVGASAKQRKVIDPKNTIFSIKRLIGRSFDSAEVQIAKRRMPYAIEPGDKGTPVVVTRAGRYAVPEVSAIVLDYAKQVATAQLETEVARAVVTVPASFNDAQRSATATAGAIAGLTVVRVLNEPTAAALAYGHARNLREVIAVYDFGGGTFDITLLKLHDQVYEVLGTAGDTFLGGDDLDERVVDRMVEKFLTENRVDLRQNEVSMMRLRAVAEQTKIELSRRSRAVVKIDEIAYGPRGKPLDLQIEISRDEFVMQVADIIDRTFPVCEEALKYAGLSIDQIDDIVLVGGTTKIPYVRDQATRFFAKAPRTDVNPEDAVALGAALQATALDRILKRKRPSRAPTTTETPDEETTAAGVLFGDDPLAGDTVTRETGADMLPPDMDQVIDELTLEPPKPRPRQTADYGEIPVVRSPNEVRLERPVERGRHHDQFEERTPATASVPPPVSATPRAPIGRLRTSPPVALTPPAPVEAKTLPLGQAAPPPPPPPHAAIPQPVAPQRTRAMPIPRPPAHVPPAPPQAPTLMIEPPGFAGARSDAERRGVSVEPSPATTAPGMGQASPGTTSPTLIALSPASTAPGFAAPPPPPLAPPPIAPALPPTVMGYPVMASPVVIDVTPRGLGIATVAGFCEELIRRNSRVPTEIRKLFTTSRDLQDAVRIVVVQGESRRMDQNIVIGDLRLENLPARARGETSIEVTFALDASGILQVRARDAQTGLEQRASLDVVGSMPQEDVAASRDRLQSLRR